MKLKQAPGKILNAADLMAMAQPESEHVELKTLNGNKLRVRKLTMEESEAFYRTSSGDPKKILLELAEMSYQCLLDDDGKPLFDGEDGFKKFMSMKPEVVNEILEHVNRLNTVDEKTVEQAAKNLETIPSSSSNMTSAGSSAAPSAS